MADGAPLRRSVRAHLAAGCLAVTGIAGLAAAYLFPLVLAASSKGPREAGFSAAMVVAGSVAFALTIWLLFYVPSSIAADMITKGGPARSWVSALLCTAGLSVAAFSVVHRSAPRPRALATGLLFAASVFIGLGCALYTFLQRRIAGRVPEGPRPPRPEIAQRPGQG